MWKSVRPLGISAIRVFCRRSQPCICKHQQSSIHSAEQEQKQPWHLLSAVCLERYPVITQKLNEIETRYQTVMDQIEFEKSVLADHEVQLREDSERLARMQSAEYDEDEEEGEARVITAADLEDLGTEELSHFTPASKTTESDEKNDLKSLERKLSEKLYLLVKCKLGKNSVWLLPQGRREDGESMRETAERVLASHCGDIIKAQFSGNAPCGFYKYKFPTESRSDEAVGAKVFFYKARLLDGNVLDANDVTEDYVWVSSKELPHYLKPSYMKSIEQFLIE
ncbi:large ribosomal subunit protein mL46-like [Saccoglossus kowalevskii]|uniref:Large ribosomal subunit protein mL46 n=1 Tax=Saccoglossus kowalevskii TaxID=10224 RepID=A0ABM0GW11_SACKO|nr:PREDICTED: 39S ribosomal protein L46, mitochondrial-like [Saccoglossus kowalevskii]